MSESRNLCACVMFIISFLCPCIFAFDGGTGIIQDPYQISTPEHLMSIGSDPDLLDKHFILTADIDMTGHNFTTAIIAPDTDPNEYEHQGPAFTGTFDGSGYKIINLTIDTKADEDPGNDYNDCLALFGKIGAGSEIKNLGITNAVINGDWDTTDFSTFLAILTAFNGSYSTETNDGGNITDCYVTGTLSGGTTASGLVYINNGSIKNCSASCQFNGNSYANSAAGLVAINSADISDCYASCTVTTHNGNVGGLVLRNHTDGNIDSCYSACHIDQSTESTFTFEQTGGIAGVNTGHIFNCYSSGSIKSPNQHSGLDGLIGSGSGLVQNCYSTCELFGNFRRINISGVSINFISSFWDIEKTGVFESLWYVSKNGIYSSICDDGKITAQMLTNSTYTDAGWDFTDTDGDPAVWKQDPNSYPVLVWQEMKTVPDVTGLTKSKARDTLIEAGLNIGKVELAYSEGAESGIIISQAVPTGQSLPMGFTVDLQVTPQAEDLYIIDEPNDLIVLSGNADLYNKYCVLTADINLAGYEFRDAVISSLIPEQGYGPEDGLAFNGTFDGNGHKIIDLTIDYPIIISYKGFISTIGETGIVKNLCIENATVQGLYSVGILAGYSEGRVRNCYTSGTVTGDELTGGIIGQNTSYASVTACSSSAQVNGWRYAGGITGGGDNTDGPSGTIKNCFFTGTVEGLLKLGGLSGTGSRIFNSFSTGSVNGSLAGGLCGLGGTIINSYSTGPVHGTQSVGGLIGYSDNSSYILNSYSSSMVSGDKETGGLIGGDELCENVINCFWDIDASGQTTSQGGEGKTTAEMQTLSTFTDAGWDFDNTWWINEGRDYPRLSWQPFADINNDSYVNITDLSIMSDAWMTTDTDPGFNSVCEMSGDNTIDIADLSVLIDMWLAEPEFPED